MNEILKTVISLSVSGLVIALVLLALKPFYKDRFSKTWQYYIWLVVIIRMLLPFSLEINLVGQLFSKQEEALTVQDDITDISYSKDIPDNSDYAPVMTQGSPLMSNQVNNAKTTPKDAPSKYWNDIRNNLWLIWLGVAIILLVQKITSYRSFIRYIRAGMEEITDDVVFKAYHKACTNLGIKKPVRVYKNRQAVSPMLAGTFRQFIVLPYMDMNACESELYNIYMHEMTHYKRLDIFYKWIMQLVLCIHWFNPIAYLINREVNKNCELSCDEQVLSELDDNQKRQYGDTLLATVKNKGNYGDIVVSVSLSEDARLLKERLGAIMKFTEKSKLIIGLSVCLSLMLIFGAAFTGAYAATSREIERVKVVGEVKVAENDKISDDREILNDKHTLNNEDLLNLRDIDEVTDNSNDIDSLYANARTNYNMVISGDKISSYSYYYQNNYIIGIRWQNYDDTVTYPEIIQFELNKTYKVAFTNDTVSYSKNRDVLDGIEKSLPAFNNFDHLNVKDEIYIITEIQGPYVSTADELAEEFFKEDNLAYFSAVIPNTERTTMLTLAEAAYEQNRISYYSVLNEILTDGIDYDEMAERSYRDRKIDFFSIIITKASVQKKAELLNLSYKEGEVSFFSVLEDKMNDVINYDEMTENAYNNRKIDFFSIIVSKASVPKREEILYLSYKEGEISFFSILVNMLGDDVNYDEMAGNAFKDRKIDFFSIIVSKISKSKKQEISDLAYEEGEISFLSILMLR